MLTGRQKLAVGSLCAGVAAFSGYVGAKFSRSHALTAPESGMIQIQVSGAVKNPGVVKVASGARMEEALKLAGGTIREADTSRVNLAESVEDGMKVRVPYVNEAEDKPVVTRSERAGFVSKNRSAAPGMGGVSLNQGSQADLEGLPGVGPAIAKRILDYRNAQGGFRTIEELDNVKGIGPKNLAKIRPYLRLN